MSECPQILGPIPRRYFEITPTSTESSIPPSPSPENTNPELLGTKLHDASPPSRTRSILNLTSSTLLGIYSPTGAEGPREGPSTPWGTGAQTPSHRQSVDDRPSWSLSEKGDLAPPRTPFDRRKTGLWRFCVPLFLRESLLFVIGLAYGTLITHLHDNQNFTFAPVKFNTFDRRSWSYMVFWGLAGVTLGSMQPWFDHMWSNFTTVTRPPLTRPRRRDSASSAHEGDMGDVLGSDWMPVVRSIGAFVGIAFAIRKLPWQSTMQASLSLALVNPVLWYLLDRSKPGFVLSTIVGVVGTVIFWEVQLNTVPSPAMQPSRVTLAGVISSGVGTGGFISQESVGVGTWIASVLFCSSICFGNIGRRLALGQQSAIR